MITSLVVSLVGIVSVVVLNLLFFDFTWDEQLWLVGCANIAVVTTLLSVLKLQTYPRFQKLFLGSIPKSWLFAAILFALQVWICCPLKFQANHIKGLLGLLIPLVMASGLGVIAFGVIRDFQVRMQARGGRSVLPVIRWVRKVFAD
jgi:hypothetical protein